MIKVGVIGSGNWGTTIAKVIASNIVASSNFDPELLLWVNEEMYQHQKLSEYINAFRINPIYLPGIKLPENVRAVTELELMNDADVLVICMPSRYLDTLKQIKPKKGAFAVNLCKGFIRKGKSLYMPSQYIKELLEIDCCCLMGPNIAFEVAFQKLTECTVGYTRKEQITCLEWMFDNEYFKPKMIPYNQGIEICGGLKNIISTGFGIADGMEWGSNTKAILFRKGIVEMERFSRLIGAKFMILESCCIGDLLTSCLSGRNYKCGVELAKKRCKSEDIERSMGGQKLEGAETAKVIFDWLKETNNEEYRFPLFEAVYRICFLGEAPEYLHSVLKKSQE